MGFTFNVPKVMAARLHFASMAADTLTLTVGGEASRRATWEISPGQEITASWKGTVVFRGTAEQIVEREESGTEIIQDVVVQGPWSKFARTIFQQSWGSAKSAHVILNQSASGANVSHQTQLSAIVTEAVTECGVARGTVEGSSVSLPFDETRDITLAMAFQRILRYFPKTIVRFDYAPEKPVLHVERTGRNATYIATAKETNVQKELNAHPISGVYLYTETFDGSGIVPQYQAYPVGTRPGTPDALVAYVPTQPAVSDVNAVYFNAEGEEIPGDLNNVGWWRIRHPRLDGLRGDQIIITNATRSSSAYSYIAKSTTEEIESAGKHTEVCTFKCNATIRTEDDEEEDLILTMDYLTTDAVPGERYLVSQDISVASGTSIPSGLAKAIMDERSGALKNEHVTMKLESAWPVLSDILDGLMLREFDVDCMSRLATLHFGQPEYLSVDDMHGLLTGFRGRSFAKASLVRKQSGADEEDDESVFGDGPALKPLSSTEFCPGVKAKTTVKKNGKSIILDPSKIDTSLGGSTIDVKTLTIKKADGTELEKLQILSTDDAEVQLEGDEGGGEVKAGTEGAEVQGQKIYIKVTEDEDGAQIVDLSTTQQSTGAEQEEAADDKTLCNKWSKDNNADRSDNDDWSGGGGGDDEDDLPEDGWSGNPCPQD